MRPPNIFPPLPINFLINLNDLNTLWIFIEMKCKYFAWNVKRNICVCVDLGHFDKSTIVLWVNYGSFKVTLVSSLRSFSLDFDLLSALKNLATDPSLVFDSIDLQFYNLQRHPIKSHRPHVTLPRVERHI